MEPAFTGATWSGMETKRLAAGLPPRPTTVPGPATPQFFLAQCYRTWRLTDTRVLTDSGATRRRPRVMSVKSGRQRWEDPDPKDKNVWVIFEMLYLNMEKYKVGK